MNNRGSFHPPCSGYGTQLVELESITYRNYAPETERTTMIRHRLVEDLSDIASPRPVEIYRCKDCGYTSTDINEFDTKGYVNEWNCYSAFDKKIVCNRHHKRALLLSCGHEISHITTMDWYPPITCPHCHERRFISFHWYGDDPGTATHKYCD